MKKLLYLQILPVLIFLPAAVKSQSGKKADSSDLKNRIGKYEYTYTESKTAGGSVPVIEYRIVVSAKGDSLAARFTADGYQSNDDYSCTAKATGNQLNLYFLKDLRRAVMPGMNSRFTKG